MGHFDSHFGQGRFHPRHYYPHFQFLLSHTTAEYTAPVTTHEIAPAYKYTGLKESPYEPGRFYPAYFYQSFHGRPPLISAPRLPAPPVFIPLPYPDVIFRPPFEGDPHHPYPYPQPYPQPYPAPSGPPHFPDDPVVVRPPHYPPSVPRPETRPDTYPPQTPAPRPQRPSTQGGYNRDAIAGALKGALSGRVDSVINIALRHGLNPAFFAAVIVKESSGGSSKAATDGRNNFTGISGSGRPQHLGSTPEQGLEKGAALLAKYLKRHGATIAAIPAIARIYSPVGAKNDPYGTNGTWPSGVLSSFRKFGGQQSLSATGGGQEQVARGKDGDGAVNDDAHAPQHYAGMDRERRGRRQTEPLSALSRMARGKMGGLAQRMMQQNVFQNSGRGFEQAENIQTEQFIPQGFQGGMMGQHGQRRTGRGVGALSSLAGLVQQGTSNPFARRRNKGPFGFGMDDMGMMG